MNTKVEIWLVLVLCEKSWSTAQRSSTVLL